MPPNELVWALTNPGDPSVAISHSDRRCSVLQKDRSLARRCGGNDAIDRRPYKHFRALEKPACPLCSPDHLDESLLENCTVKTADGLRYGSVVRWRVTPDEKWFAIVRYRSATGSLVVEVRPIADLAPDHE